MSEIKIHRAGFVNIIGNPNVGKSTLMNAIVGERMSIITHKPQTTRHRIIGIVSQPEYQIVFSDTPGFITTPSYKMQERMNVAVLEAFEDADAMLWVIDATDEQEIPDDHPLLGKLQRLECPLFLVINKMDAVENDRLEVLKNQWQSRFPNASICPISALQKTGVTELLTALADKMPIHPPYYPDDQLTDKPERFFVSEIIREKILLLYHQEIPYSCEVVVESFKEDGIKGITRIRAIIYVVRASQKNIVVGKAGEAIKQLGIAAREDIEKFLDQKVFLDLFVKVRDNWRDDEQTLKHFGYEA